MATAVIGALGQLGRQIAADIRLGHADIDLADGDSVVAALDRGRPSGVFLVAAQTNVDGCERDPDHAFAVNAEGPRRVARWCREQGAWLLYASTDYVFDGRKTSPYVEDDEPHPLSVYGSSKLAGEAAVREECPRHFIVRSSWIFGPGGTNFVTKILDAARQRPELSGVEDEVATPTYAPDLAGAFPALVATRRYGTYHLTNSGMCSRREYMQAILELAGLPNPVRGMRLADYERPARPPNYSVLSNERAAAAGIRLRPWRDALADYLLGPSSPLPERMAQAG